MLPKIKICGLNNLSNIQEVIALEVDFVGFIFWEHSKRKFQLDSLEIITNNCKKVGVFVNESFENIVEKVHNFKLDYVQLHGNEEVDFCKSLKDKNIKIIKAFSIAYDFDFQQLIAFEPLVDYFLFDTKGKLPGGNGFAFNWEILNNYPLTKPFFLSGGIGKEDANKIIEFLNSNAGKYCEIIDLNSKFEKNIGEKDILLLQKFLNDLKKGLIKTILK